jgi:hypothetical protein
MSQPTHANSPAEVPTAGSDKSGQATTSVSRREVHRMAPRRPQAKSAPGFRVSWRIVTTWVFLAVVAVVLRQSQDWFEVYFRKSPVPLKRSLAGFDRNALLPEFELHPRPTRTIGEDELQTLGTHEYVTIRMVDRLKSDDDRTQVAEVFITYYTGQPDMVPHVPDECYLAGGFERVGVPYTERFKVRGAGADDNEIPVRVIKFRGRRGEIGESSEDRDFAIFYFFRANDQYATTRNEVRLLLSDPFDRFAYYSKIEIRLMDQSLSRLASEEEGFAELPRVLEKLMPILLRDHFTTLEEVAAASAAESENS